MRAVGEDAVGGRLTAAVAGDTDDTPSLAATLDVDLRLAGRVMDLGTSEEVSEA
jgi:hypothetical protein